jgi:hypothetical protein
MSTRSDKSVDDRKTITDRRAQELSKELGDLMQAWVGVGNQTMVTASSTIEQMLVDACEKMRRTDCGSMMDRSK